MVTVFQSQLHPSIRSGLPGSSQSKTLNTESYIELCTPFLLLLLEIRAAKHMPTYELREQIEKYIAKIGAEAHRLRFLEDHTEAISFMLAACTDEMVLLRDFDFKMSWEQQPVQLRLFNENNAGQTIYQRLDTIYLKNIEYWGPVLELYYLCFLMGYEGQCRFQETEKRWQTIEQMKDALHRLNRLRMSWLSPHWQQTDQPPEPKRPVRINIKRLIFWMVLTGSICLGLVYCLFRILQSFDINRFTQSLLH